MLPMPPCTWIAVSHTVRAARAQYALATAPGRAARRRAASASTAHAACSATLSEPSIRHARLGEQVLHGLERADRHAVLLALLGVRRRSASSTPPIVPTRSATVIASASARDCVRSRPRRTAAPSRVRRDVAPGRRPRPRAVRSVVGRRLGAAPPRPRWPRRCRRRRPTSSEPARPIRRSRPRRRRLTAGGHDREVEQRAVEHHARSPRPRARARRDGRGRRRRPVRGTACRPRRVPARGR